ncbi:rhamnogalacturonan lyase family protein [Actinomadura madurae]|uniref:rhamnogalacturonan lyase family protein n=1 Tax=Actinomadura madurae TaxID=1993 RepID=UPI00355896DA
MSAGDVDGDGRDEIVYGAMAVDDDGRGLWTARTGHGDAQHLGDFDPARPGLEYFKVSESSGQPSSLYLDPRSGQVLWSTPACCDNGRGVAGDVWAGRPGAEFWSASVSELRGVTGNDAGRKPSSINFLAWWDADPVRELLDGTRVDKYGTSGDTRLLTASGVHSNNGTKAVPSLSGDLFGDWREEAVWPSSDDTRLRVFTTREVTDRKIYTLLHDTQYRTALAWQNTAYNQPPHPSFFLGDGMSAPPRPQIYVR